MSQLDQETTGHVDVLSIYLRDVDERDRLSREEETRTAEEIARCHEDIVELLRGLVLDATDALGLDAGAAARLRAEISDPANDGWQTRLQRKLESIAALARQQLQVLRKAGRARAAVARARLLLAEITTNFGVSPEVIDRIATSVADKQRHIQDAKQRLVEGNLRLVVYFARRVKWPGVAMEDLIQEGNIALMRAADSFDPKRGYAFGSFACAAIRRAMHRFASAASQPVHVPVEVRARRARVHQVARHLSEKYGRAASWDEIADYLEAPKAIVVDALGVGDEAIPLDAPFDVGGTSLIERLADPAAEDASESLETAEDEQHIRAAVTRLDERDRVVLEARFGLGDVEPASLATIGQGLGLTRERARQLESRALRRLRDHGSAPGGGCHRARSPRRKTRATGRAS